MVSVLPGACSITTRGAPPSAAMSSGCGNVISSATGRVSASGTRKATISCSSVLATFLIASFEPAGMDVVGTCRRRFGLGRTVVATGGQRQGADRQDGQQQRHRTAIAE